MFTIFQEGIGTAGALGTVKDFGLDKLSKFFSSFAGSATLGIATFFAMKKAIEALSDAYNLSYDSAMKNTQANVDSFNTTKTEISDLESEAKQYKETLSSLGDKYEVDLSGIESIDEIITKLRQSGKLELTDEAELAKIDSQNAALERQLAIKEKLLLSQQKQAASDARDALGRGEQSVAQQVAQFVPGGKKRYQGQVNNVGVVEAVNENVLAIQKYEDAIANAENAMKDLDPNSKAWKEQEENINSYNEAIEKLTEDLNTKEADLSTLLSAFSVDGEGLVALDGFEKEFKSVKDAVENLNNINLSPAQQELASLESFFDGSFGKNKIKEQLLESLSSTEKLEEELSRLGLTLDDIGIESISSLSDYLKEVKKEAEEATDSVHDYASTVSDIEKASESADQDKNWSTVSESYKEAKELLEEGKTGTDNFQAMASFLNPEKVKELAEKGGKYTADAYQKAFEEVKKTANRWFGEDETKSMENFVNDFKKEGLFDVTTDEMGLWDIETNFKTTAEAADKFGISIEAVETMLKALGAYGYEFEGITFSGDALSEYESYLGNIRTMYDELDDSNLKNRLGKIIEEADLADFENHIEELSPEIIADIKFEYDLAQIDQEIQKLKDAASGEGYTNTTSNAELMASSEYRSSQWRNENSKVKKDSGYVGLDKTIDSLEDSMVGKSGDELANIQRQIMAVQELRTAFEDAYDAAEADGKELNWDDYINSTEANDALSSIAEKLGVTEDELESIFGKEFTLGITSDINMNNVRHLREEIDKLERDSSITFEASVDGVDTVVEAVRDVHGNVKYYADVNGVTTELAAVENIDGTVSYVPVTDLVDKHDYDQDGIVDYKGIFPTSAPNLKATVKYSYSYAHDGTLPSENLKIPRASGTFLSPAHKDGTAYNVLNTTTLSAYAGGRVGLPRNERALVNEEYINGHSESIVRDGVWRLIPGGAHIENLKQGDLIFSAQQTEDLLRSGRTLGHARAFAQGNVLAPAYRLGSSSSGAASSDTSNKTAAKTSSKTSSKTSKSVQKALDAIADWFDWIEVHLDRLARSSEKAEQAIERAVGLSETLTLTNKAITSVNKEQEAAEKGAARYLKAAQQVAKNTGLSADLQKKVQDGTIDIVQYGEETQKKIQEYQNWYEKYLDCLDQVAELEDQEIELAISRLDKITEYYDAIASVHDTLIDSNEAYLEYRENSGYSAFSNLIKELLQDTIAEAEIIKSKARENYYSYEREFNDLLESGALKEDSVEYYDRLSQLNELKTAYYEASSAVIEHADALREIEYTKLQYAIDGFARITDKLQNYIELLESRDEIISESLYTRQITSNNNQIDTQYELRRQKLEEQKLYSVQSVRYKELADEIADIDNEIITLLTDNEKLKDSIVELRYDPLTKSIEQLQEARTELEDFMDLLNEEAFFDSKTGELTGEGVAQVYLLEQALISSKQEIADYTKGLEKLNEDLANGNISQEEFNEKNVEYRKGIRNATKDVKSYADTLTDLYIQQMQSENKLLQDVIDKRKEALQAKEKYYQYDKTLKNANKDLNLLRAQAAALEGV